MMSAEKRCMANGLLPGFNVDAAHRALARAGMPLKTRGEVLSRLAEGLTLSLPLAIDEAAALGICAHPVICGKGPPTPQGSGRNNGLKFRMTAARRPEEADTRHDCGHLHNRLADAARCARRIQGQVYREVVEGKHGTRVSRWVLVEGWDTT